jgi:hypothetical protein
VPAGPQKAGYILPQTFLSARSEYQYFRFGLGFTLMRDGYFTHELGDSWHGQDWDYDELHLSLGLPLANASAANVTNYVPPPPPPPIPLTQPWGLYVRDPATANASWAVDAAVRPPVAGAPASVRVDVVGTAAANDGIDLSQIVASFEDGAYELTFWAKASVDGTPAALNSRKNGGDWHNFGLAASITLSAAWQFYSIDFVSSSDGSAGRLSWYACAVAPPPPTLPAPALFQLHSPPPCAPPPARPARACAGSSASLRPAPPSG